MGLFKHIHKSSRLSRLLLGIVAICSLPITPINANESEIKSANVQQITSFYQLANKRLVLRQQLQHFYPSETKFNFGLQTVTFSPFFAKKYQSLKTKANPIRAGPTFLY